MAFEKNTNYEKNWLLFQDIKKSLYTLKKYILVSSVFETKSIYFYCCYQTGQDSPMFVIPGCTNLEQQHELNNSVLIHTAEFKKGDRNTPETCRPVFLYSIACKTLEQIVFSTCSIQKHLEAHSKFILSKETVL